MSKKIKDKKSIKNINEDSKTDYINYNKSDDTNYNDNILSE